MPLQGPRAESPRPGGNQPIETALVKAAAAIGCRFNLRAIETNTKETTWMCDVTGNVSIISEGLEKKMLCIPYGPTH